MWYITIQLAKVCIVLTTSLAYYHPPSLIYITTSWSSRKSLVVACSLGHLDYESLQKFFIPNGACTSSFGCLWYLMCGLYTWEAPPQTFSISSYLLCHIHFGVSASRHMRSNVTHDSYRGPWYFMLISDDCSHDVSRRCMLFLAYNCDFSSKV